MEHLQHLSKDKRLKTILSKQEPCILTQRNHVYLQLCGSIISQQLSTKVAKVIYTRFLNLYKSKAPTRKQILDTPLTDLRSIGLSNAKA